MISIIRCKKVCSNYHYNYYNICNYIRKVNRKNHSSNHTTCWKCNTHLLSSSLLSSLYCINKECNVIQQISRNNCNYFDLFNIKQSFLLDEKQLGNHYYYHYYHSNYS